MFSHIKIVPSATTASVSATSMKLEGVLSMTRGLVEGDADG